jgi:hypothetical protein
VTIPHIDRVAFVATDAQVQLAAVASSYFHNSLYTPVFRFPSLDYPYSPVADIAKDGYIARIMGDRVAHKINNVLARVQPTSIFLLGLKETEKSYLRGLLPSKLLVDIDSPEQLAIRFTNPSSVREQISCRSTELLNGLLYAKANNNTLAIRDDAPPLPSTYLRGGDVLVVIEAANTVDELAALNYAFSIEADIAIVPPIDRHELMELARQLEAWSNDNSHFEYQQLKAKATKRLKGLDISRYKCATFFTTGLPYGLFVKNVIPCSHVMKDINCGVFILNALLEEHSSSGFGSALVFSPESFTSEETDEVISLLNDNNYIVKPLVGKDATASQLSAYGAHFPYNLMHICSHGGETDGYFVVQRFKDREGVEHTLEYYEIVGFEPSSRDMVRVHRKAIFKRFDGFAWLSKPLKEMPRYIFEDMTKAMKQDERVIRTRFDSKIALSAHIRCSESIHQGDFDTLAGYGSPIVFNNTCSSSHELAAMLIDAGARSYLGTLWGVGNETAKNAALVFYKEALISGNILNAFHAMTLSLNKKKYRNVYILWGLHLSSFEKPASRSDGALFHALVASYLMWMKKITTTKDPEVKRNSIPVVRFLMEAIASNFSEERLKELVDFDPQDIDEEERVAPQCAADEFSGGMREMDIVQERSLEMTKQRWNEK